MSLLDKFKSKKPKVEVETVEELPEPKGKLAVDFYRKGQELKIIAPIAGVSPEQLDISINNEMLVIKGRREKPYSKTDKTYCEECYWGPFVRKLMLPQEIDKEEIRATKDGEILTITLPLSERKANKKIKVEQ
ncbi:MAG: Hsp20/alpha crystallin family protein [Candidatus Paceibacterota bacterium]